MSLAPQMAGPSCGRAQGTAQAALDEFQDIAPGQARGPVQRIARMLAPADLEADNVYVKSEVRTLGTGRAG